MVEHASHSNINTPVVSLTSSVGSTPPGSNCSRWPSEMLTAKRSHQGISGVQISARGEFSQPLYAVRVASISSRWAACVFSTYHIAADLMTAAAKNMADTYVTLSGHLTAASSVAMVLTASEAITS